MADITPTPAFRFCVAYAAFIAFVTVGAAAAGELDVPTCENWWDYLTGCGSGVGTFMSFFVLGTIPGAPDDVNTILAIVGVSVRAEAIWSLIRMFRGGG